MILKRGHKLYKSNKGKVHIKSNADFEKCFCGFDTSIQGKMILSKNDIINYTIICKTCYKKYRKRIGK